MERPKLILAPLRGVTQRPFRECLAEHFPGFDEAVSPFLTTLAGNRIKATHLADVLPEKNRLLPVIPQIIGKSASDFRTLLHALKELGYERCDLNAGCPWPMIIKRGRGAGLMKDGDNLRRMLDVGCEEMGGGFSLKVRLGLERPDQLLEQMDVLNQYPLRVLTIHARTARQMYEGSVDLENFEKCLQVAKMPVVYNGDISDVEEFEKLRKRFPKVCGWMIGRAVVRDPTLPVQIRGGKIGEKERVEAAWRFMADYSGYTKEALEGGPSPFLGRMKEFWSYFKEGIPNGDEYWKKVRIAKSYGEYFEAIR